MTQQFALTVSSLPVTNPPVLKDINFEMIENNTYIYNLEGIVENNTDNLKLSYYIETEPTYGTVTIDTSGDINLLIYVPNTNYVGQDNIKISVLYKDTSEQDQTNPTIWMLRKKILNFI